jgi:purine-cytosine permease-like protein
MNSKMVVAGLIVVVAGLAGAYLSIKNTKGPRERAFMIKAIIIGWIFVLALVFGLRVLPRSYHVLIIPIYIAGAVAGIMYSNKKQAQIRAEESERKP